MPGPFVRSPAVRRAWGWLIRLHRWLGVGGALLFVAWFASGVVMVYHRMPRLGTAERLAGVAPLTGSRIHLTPADAAGRLGGGPPERIRLTMLLDRPVYRFLGANGRWSGVYADDGTIVPPADSAMALRVAAALAGTRGLRYRGLLETPDQWTLSSPIRRQAPLHLIDVEDPAGTRFYVSQATGEAVMKTTRSTRFWGFTGAVVHWFFFTPLRRRTTVWINLVIYGALAGAVLCLSGLVVGLYRLRLAPRYRSGRVTPHYGWLRWHHYLGLAFGLLSFTWIFSGMLSMSPWDWSPGPSPSQADRRLAAGGTFDPGRVAVPPAAALARLGEGLREVEILQANGRPFYYAFDPPANPAPTEWENTDEAGYLGPEPSWPSRLLPADDPAGTAVAALPESLAVGAALAVRPGVGVADRAWLDRYDAYYYHRRPDGRHLPVLRVRFVDGTWLYFDPRLAVPVLVLTPVSRVERWVYHGLHSLDFPGLYQSGGWWEFVVLLGSAGGLLLSGTAVAIAAKRLGRRRRPVA